jgi:hypothetical protein
MYFICGYYTVCCLILALCRLFFVFPNYRFCVFFIIVRFKSVFLFLCFSFYFVCSVFLYCFSSRTQLFLFYLCTSLLITAVNKYHIITYIIVRHTHRLPDIAIAKKKNIYIYIY